MLYDGARAIIVLRHAQVHYGRQAVPLGVISHGTQRGQADKRHPSQDAGTGSADAKVVNLAPRAQLIQSLSNDEDLNVTLLLSRSHLCAMTRGGSFIQCT